MNENVIPVDDKEVKKSNSKLPSNDKLEKLEKLKAKETTPKNKQKEQENSVLTQVPIIETNVASSIKKEQDESDGSTAVANGPTDVNDSSTIASNSSTIASNSSTIASNSSTVASNSSTVASNSSTVASNSSTVVSNSSTVASNSSTVASNSSTVASDGSVISDSTVKDSQSMKQNPIDYINVIKLLSLDDIFINLNLIAKIEVGDKLYVNDKYINIDTSYVKSIIRWYYGVDRKLTINFVRLVIAKSFEFCDILLTSNTKLLFRLTNDLKNSISGLTKLKQTYFADKLVQSEIDVIIEGIREKIELTLTMN